MNQAEDLMLVVTSGGEEMYYRLEQQTLILGRDPEADVVLPDDGNLISRRHAELSWRENMYWITDCSINGSLLGGVPLARDNPAIWFAEQVLSIGDYRLRLQPASAFTEAQLVVEPGRADLECGREQQFNLLLSNNGSLVNQYRLELGGLNPAWVNLTSTREELMPGHSVSVRLAVLAPRDATSGSGDYTLRIRVGDKFDHTVAVRLIPIVVLPFYDHAVSIRPAHATASRPVTLRIDNKGNEEDSYDIVLSDKREALSFDPPRMVLHAMPGAAAEARFVVRERARRLIGPKVDHEVLVDVTPARGRADINPSMSVAAGGCLAPWLASVVSILLVIAAASVMMLLNARYSGAKAAEATALATTAYSETLKAAATRTADWLMSDDDADKLRNGEEIEYGTLPAVADTDGDGLWDGDEVFVYFTNPVGIGAQDSDGDGLADGDEVQKKCDPLDSDTDDDGLLDGDTRDPNCRSSDSDGDGTPDGVDTNNSATPVPPSATPTPTETPTVTPSPTPTETPTPPPPPGPSVITSVTWGASQQDGCVEIGWLISGVTSVRLSVNNGPAEGVAGDDGGNYVRWVQPACFTRNTPIIWQIEFEKLPPLICMWEVKIRDDGTEDIVPPANLSCVTPGR